MDSDQPRSAVAGPDEAPTQRTGASRLGPVRVPSAVDGVADRLLTAIALGEFSVGERLPTERELTEILKVSRPTVRAAIARLREIGCVDVVRGRSGGHYVRSDWREESAPAIRRTLLPRWEQITTLLDTRGLIESLIARTAAQRRDEQDVERITGALADYAAARDAAGIRHTDSVLHRAIARAAKNEPLARYARQLLQDISAGFPIEPFRGSQTDRALAEHRELVGAVVDGDADRAAQAALHHFTITEDTLRATLDRSLHSCD